MRQLGKDAFNNALDYWKPPGPMNQTTIDFALTTNMWNLGNKVSTLRGPKKNINEIIQKCEKGFVDMSVRLDKLDKDKAKDKLSAREQSKRIHELMQIKKKRIRH